jgi:hypothetical protein
MKNELKERYSTQFKAIQKLLNKFDPSGLIGAGAPEDEYDCLTHKILSNINKNKDDLRTIILNEIVNHFGTTDINTLTNNIKFNQELNQFTDNLSAFNK